MNNWYLFLLVCQIEQEVKMKNSSRWEPRIHITHHAGKLVYIRMYVCMRTYMCRYVPKRKRQRQRCCSLTMGLCLNKPFANRKYCKWEMHWLHRTYQALQQLNSTTHWRVWVIPPCDHSFKGVCHNNYVSVLWKVIGLLIF